MREEILDKGEVEEKFKVNENKFELGLFDEIEILRDYLIVYKHGNESRKIYKCDIKEVEANNSFVSLRYYEDDGKEGYYYSNIVRNGSKEISEEIVKKIKKWVSLEPEVKQQRKRFVHRNLKSLDDVNYDGGKVLVFKDKKIILTDDHMKVYELYGFYGVQEIIIEKSDISSIRQSEINEVEQTVRNGSIHSSVGITRGVRIGRSHPVYRNISTSWGGFDTTIELNNGEKIYLGNGCKQEDVANAKRVSEELNIWFYSHDLQETADTLDIIYKKEEKDSKTWGYFLFALSIFGWIYLIVAILL